MTDEPQKKPSSPELELGWEYDDEDPEANARPTVAPPFDFAEFAKEAMVPSGDAHRAVPGPQPGGPSLPVTQPGMEAASEAPRSPGRVVSLPPPPPLPSRPPPRASVFPPASKPASGPRSASAPTSPPPAPARATMPPPADAAGLAEMSAVNTPPPPSDEPPSQRITPREMKALEAALILSREEGRAPPAPPEPPRPPRGDTLLNLANLRAPTHTPLRVPVAVAPSPLAAPAKAAASGVANPIVEMQERFALGDYSGALVMAESMLDENPTHTEAREYAESCRSVLQQMYTARIGPLDRVPVVDIASDQLRWLSIDHRTGFILSLVDGISSLEMILDVCGMPPLDALRMLFELVQQRIISLRDG